MSDKKSILICDDEEDILEVLSIILASEYEVHVRTIVDDVINEVLQVKPDLILMDHWIPKIGGKKATQLLKSDERTKDIKILFFSANNEIKDIAEDSGADGYISKPFQTAPFKSYIKHKLQN